MNKSSKPDRPALHISLSIPFPGRPARSSSLSYQCQVACVLSRTPCPMRCRCTCACKSHMRLSQTRMTPCNRFKTSPTKENRYRPHKSPARPISHTAKPPAFGPLTITRSLAFSLSLLSPASCLSPSHQVLKKVRYRVEEEKILFSKPHSVVSRDARLPRP